ncbi:MAG: RNA polymerase factor sigma-54 [Bacteroidales bacterium]|nr:RNA polymerase factor sigma-54 [Bacteroidales bacterium]
MLRQRLEQKLLQKLSPQQIQLMKLLQVPAIAMEQRIKQEIEENPALEEFEEEEKDFEDDPFEEQEETEFEEKVEDDFSLDDYLDGDETPDYKLSANNTSRDDEDRQVPFVSHTTFYDGLEEQLHMRRLSESDRSIGEFIIGNLDENGYLKRDAAALVNDLAFTQNIIVRKEDVARMIKLIQQFDPPGVGAFDLKECLALQLNRIEKESVPLSNARLIIDRMFDEFTKKHYEKIKKKFVLTDDDLKDAIDVILSLNPKPGSTFADSSKGSEHVFPDFTILNEDGELVLVLNSKNVPELRVNRTYFDMLESYAKSKNQDAKTKEALQFVKQKIDSARWFIDAIKQRQNTLFVTMSAIMSYQEDYFLTGDDTRLRPMILKDIADLVGLDISTISRVASSKYVQTDFGTFLLKSFFSESMQTESGEEVSSREIKSILTDLLSSEDKKKPITDEVLAAQLKEKGYNIARRTVAKYREQLNIPVARLRKEI